jgi:hypothetical protein
MGIIYPTLYNGPVNYYARLIREKEIHLEQYDNYIKQTYRNRCRILSPNGVLTLSIPVKRRRGTKTLLRDVRIDYDSPWNHIHWKSLQASYASSPFFEYLVDDLAIFYERHFQFLVDLNQQILQQTLQVMGLEIPVILTRSFSAIAGEQDPRELIDPKKDQTVVDPDFKPVAYHQVFSDRFGFQSNLSILDLLFNEGPSAYSILQQSLRT